MQLIAATPRADDYRCRYLRAATNQRSCPRILVGLLRPIYLLSRAGSSTRILSSIPLKHLYKTCIGCIFYPSSPCHPVYNHIPCTMPVKSSFPDFEIPNVDTWSLMFERPDRPYPDDKCTYLSMRLTDFIGV